jgi:hypothetical protein
LDKDVEIKASRMWEVRTKIMPVIIGAIGTIKTGIDQNRQLLLSQASAIELQKITLVYTAHSIHKVLG